MTKLYTKVEEPFDVDVLVPFTKPTDRLQMVLDCLRIQQVQPQLVKVGRDDSYWRMLRDAWSRGRTFFVVEHDVVVWLGAIRAMTECDQGWCTLPLTCHGRLITTTLGCVKFDATLIERYPGMWDDIPPIWHQLDAGFADKIGWPYIKPHVHGPAATHLNEVQWPDEVSTRYSLERKVVWQSMEAGAAVASVKFKIEGDKHADRVAHANVERYD